MKLCRRKRLCPNTGYYISFSLDGLGRTTKNLRIFSVTTKIWSGYLVDRIVKRYQFGPSCSLKKRRSKIRLWAMRRWRTDRRGRLMMQQNAGNKTIKGWEQNTLEDKLREGKETRRRRRRRRSAKRKPTRTREGKEWMRPIPLKPTKAHQAKNKAT